jgi:hypothetical protein
MHWRSGCVVWALCVLTDGVVLLHGGIIPSIPRQLGLSDLRWEIGEQVPFV